MKNWIVGAAEKAALGAVGGGVFGFVMNLGLQRVEALANGSLGALSSAVFYLSGSASYSRAFGGAGVGAAVGVAGVVGMAAMVAGRAIKDRLEARRELSRLDNPEGPQSQNRFGL